MLRTCAAFEQGRQSRTTFRWYSADQCLANMTLWLRQHTFIPLPLEYCRQSDLSGSHDRCSSPCEVLASVYDLHVPSSAHVMSFWLQAAAFVVFFSWATYYRSDIISNLSHAHAVIQGHP
ncbi:hypothetical protein AcV5_010303 [Taiwanofungus camphoratus]|nr:hypothetical protein AcV5_010303 [Antrodia cinnamomea]KAI0946287.1 hypothetical protein AcV7_010305 [Antrodia cinnamomea]